LRQISKFLNNNLPIKLHEL